MQAKDIPEEEIIQATKAYWDCMHSRTRQGYWDYDDVLELVPTRILPYPPKVIREKMRKMCKKGLLNVLNSHDIYTLP